MTAVTEIVTDYLGSRDLLKQLFLRDLRIRYKQTIMGVAWALLMPFAFVLAGSVLRLAAVHGASSAFASIGNVAIRSVCWAFVSSGIAFGTQSLIGNTTLVSKIYFPREILPAAAVMTQGVDALIGGALLAIALPWLGAQASFALLWVPLLAAILWTFVFAAALACSAANLFYRDVKYLVQVGTTMGIFFTPVFFSPAELGPTAAKLLQLNPLTPMFEGMRLAIMQGHNLLEPLMEAGRDGVMIQAWSPWQLVYGLAASVLMLIGASLFFHRVEFSFAERV